MSMMDAPVCAPSCTTRHGKVVLAEVPTTMMRAAEAAARSELSKRKSGSS